jgi:hypothetical protein
MNLVYAPVQSAGNASYEDAKVHLPQPEQWDPGESPGSRVQECFIPAEPARR